MKPKSICSINKIYCYIIYIIYNNKCFQHYRECKLCFQIQDIGKEVCYINCHRCGNRDRLYLLTPIKIIQSVTEKGTQTSQVTLWKGSCKCSHVNPSVPCSMMLSGNSSIFKRWNVWLGDFYHIRTCMEVVLDSRPSYSFVSSLP